MQAKEQSISDATLIERLRHYAQIAHAAAAWGFAGEGEVMSRAADRIEQLVATNEALVLREEKLCVLLSAAGSVADIQKQRAERLEALLDRAVNGPWLDGDLERARAALTQKEPEDD